MTRNIIAALLAGTIGLGLVAPAVAEDWRHQDGDYRYRDRNWRDDDWRDRRDWRRDGVFRSERQPTYEPSGSCTFQSNRGPVRGYKPEGKDRCCIETSRGPSCQ